ncbi:MAG: hypothetical protein D6767_02615 [Candidatus Hydrogenedentota bacterium]|nr:MAG: hypothetical protein D6767_02615 [Candidatus Hydrogenedentota bacterium]
MGLLQKALELLKNKPELEKLPADVEENWEEESLEQSQELGIEPPKLETTKEDLPDPYLFQEEDELSTLPVTGQIDQQARIEALLNLLELAKELATVENEEDLYDAILFGIIGQLGVKDTAIFFKENGSVQLKAFRGFRDQFSDVPVNRSLILKTFQKEPEVFSVEAMLKKIAGPERKWLASFGASLIVPIVNPTREVFGFLLIGKAVSEFHPDDLLYAKICGELLGAFFESIERVLYYSEQKRIWKERQKYFIYTSEFLSSLGSRYLEKTNLEEFADLLNEGFQLKTYCYLRLEKKEFVPILSAGLQEESIQNLRAPISAPWLWEARHKRGWYSWENFAQDPDLSDRLKNEDLSATSVLHLLPVYVHGNLHAVFMLFQVRQPLGSEALSMLQTAILAYAHQEVAEKILQESKSETAKILKDPLYPLKNIIREKENQLLEKNIPYVVLGIQITNLGKLNVILEDQALTMRESFLNLLRNDLPHNAYSAEVFPGHFIVLVENWKKKEAWSWSKKIKKQTARHFPEEETRPLLRIKIMARPEDKFLDPDLFLFD